MHENRRKPAYRNHKQSNQAIVTLSDGLGNRRDYTLGEFGTPRSKQEYRRLIQEWEAGGYALPQAKAPRRDPTLAEAMVLFMRHALTHYRRPDGTSTNEISEFTHTFRVLKRLYAHTLARQFGPLALKSVREAMVAGSWLTEGEQERRKKKGRRIGWCRNVVNKRIGRVKLFFRWLAENEHIKGSVYRNLSVVRGLQKGRTVARETDPVVPVPLGDVEKTLPFLLPQVQALVELQIATGARPGEIAIMRGKDITMDGDLWTYRPGSDVGLEGVHKNAHRGQSRTILLGPKAQEVLRPWLRLNLEEYLFQPQEAEAARHAARRVKRASPMTPSQQARKPKRRPKKAPGLFYMTSSYGHSIRKAAEKAGVPHWTPHQLRHLAGTIFRREAGLEAARCLLGHKHVTATQIYAEQDLAKAQAVISKIG